MKQAKLAAYHRKRDFKQTSEPSGDKRDARSSQAGQAIFVVQKHAARRLHYDLRLEMEGEDASQWL